MIVYWSHEVQVRGHAPLHHKGNAPLHHRSPEHFGHITTSWEVALCSVQLKNTDVPHGHRVSSPISESLLETRTPSTFLQVMSLAPRAPQIDALYVRQEYHRDKTTVTLSRVKQQVSTCAVLSSSGKHVSSMLSRYQARSYVPLSSGKPSRCMKSPSRANDFPEENKKLTRH